MRAASTTIPSTSAIVRRCRWSSRLVESGRMIRSTEECEMSRSCHERDVLERRLGVAAQHPGQAGDLLGLDRIALVGHRARALLPGAERLAHLADLGAGEMAQLGGKALQPGAGERDRAQQLGVAIAGHDLGRDRLGAPGPAAPAREPRTPERWPSRSRPRPTPRRRRPGRTPAPAAPGCARPRRRTRPA